MNIISLFIIVIILSNNASSSDICEMPIDRGTCTALIPRWGYDWYESKCVEFNYGGCDGNENRFDSELECNKKCGVEDFLPDVCEMPIVAGPCRARIRRWAYDSSKGKCVKFIYGGCEGNENNFRSKAACTEQCVGDDFKKEPVSNICDLRIVRGTCTARLRRWAYSTKKGKCVKFYYSGCGGNENNFSSKKECKKQCASATSICELPSDTGPCFGMFFHWFYNSSVGECQEFLYGGCQGNENNFSSKKKCEKRCAFATSICKLPRDSGPCFGSFIRWVYESSVGECQKFLYGGCKGNENNFKSKKECEKRCGSGKL